MASQIPPFIGLLPHSISSNPKSPGWIATGCSCISQSTLMSVCIVISIISLILFIFSVVAAITGICPLTPILVLVGLSIISLIISCIILTSVPSADYLKSEIKKHHRPLFQIPFKKFFKNPFENFWLNYATSEVRKLVRLVESNYVCVSRESEAPVYEAVESFRSKMLPVNLPEMPNSLDRIKKFIQKVESRVITGISHSPGDGNCFFHSIVHLLKCEGVSINHQEIRAACCRWLLENFRTNPLVCHFLYADILSSIDPYRQHSTPGSKMECFRKSVIECTTSYILQLAARPPSGVPYCLQAPYEGTHPVCELLLEEYISALSEDGVFVGCAMGLAASQLYERSIVLYIMSPVEKWHMTVATSDNEFVPEAVKQSGQVLLNAGYQIFEDSRNPGKYVSSRPGIVRIFGLEKCSNPVWSYVRSGPHFEPVSTASIIRSLSDESSTAESASVQPTA